MSSFQCEKNSIDASNCISNDFSRLTRSSSNSSNSAAKFGQPICSFVTKPPKVDLSPIEDDVELMPNILPSGPDDSTLAVMKEVAEADPIEESDDADHQQFLETCLDSVDYLDQEDGPSLEECEQVAEAIIVLPLSLIHI